MFFSVHRIGNQVMLIHPIPGNVNLDYLVKVVLSQCLNCKDTTALPSVITKYLLGEIL